MALVIIDKGMPTEVRFPADNVYERVLYNTFNAIKTYNMDAGEPVPAIPSFKTLEISTVEVISDDGDNIPLTNTYNRVLAVSSHIDDLAKKISYSMDLGKQL